MKTLLFVVIIAFQSLIFAQEISIYRTNFSTLQSNTSLFLQQENQKSIKKEDEKKNNLLFLELGGNGLGLSLNYERYFTNKISIRAGFGTGILEGLTFPFLINYSLEIPIEIGIGILPYSHIKESDFFNNSSSILIASSLGFKRTNKNFVFKTSFTPFFNPVNSKVLLFGGLSLGYAF